MKPKYLILFFTFLITQFCFASMKVIGIKTVDDKNYYKTTIDIIDTANKSETKPIIHVDGIFTLKPFYFKYKELRDYVLFGEKNDILVFNMKRATKAYRIGVVRLLKNGQFAIDLDAGKSMVNILLENGLSSSKDRETMYVSNIVGDVISVSGLRGKASYNADFKILDDGSYQLVKKSFEFDTDN